jgi:hypothetical protein
MIDTAAPEAGPRPTLALPVGAQQAAGHGPAAAAGGVSAAGAGAAVWSNVAYDRLLITKVRSRPGGGQWLLQPGAGRSGGGTRGVAQSLALHQRCAWPAPTTTGWWHRPHPARLKPKCRLPCAAGPARGRTAPAGAGLSDARRHAHARTQKQQAAGGARPFGPSTASAADQASAPAWC